jgi:hypothetical protein
MLTIRIEPLTYLLEDVALHHASRICGDDQAALSGLAVLHRMLAASFATPPAVLKQAANISESGFDWLLLTDPPEEILVRHQRRSRMVLLAVP